MKRLYVGQCFGDARGSKVGTIKRKIWEDDQMKFDLSTLRLFYEKLGLLGSLPTPLSRNRF